MQSYEQETAPEVAALALLLQTLPPLGSIGAELQKCITLGRKYGFARQRSKAALYAALEQVYRAYLTVKARDALPHLIKWARAQQVGVNSRTHALGMLIKASLPGAHRASVNTWTNALRYLVTMGVKPDEAASTLKAVGGCDAAENAFRHMAAPKPESRPAKQRRPKVSLAIPARMTANVAEMKNKRGALYQAHIYIDQDGKFKLWSSKLLRHISQDW